MIGLTLCLFLQAQQPLISGTKIDLDMDGKKDQIYFRSHVAQRVDYRDVNRKPAFDIEVLVKHLGKYEKAGTLLHVTELRDESVFKVMSDATTVVKQFLIMYAITEGQPTYWAVGYPAQMFMVPRELMHRGEKDGQVSK